uniref:Uncharacterized protein n=1 Tax=Chenopodium quinoa TaxID=63459 RepID=A0A803MFC5_CHEQI
MCCAQQHAIRSLLPAVAEDNAKGNASREGEGLALISQACINLDVMDLRGCDYFTTQDLITVLPLVM